MIDASIKNNLASNRTPRMPKIGMEPL
ncbi:MAG: transcriptional regulator BetI, partial [Mesorhizobium sp.]